MFRVMKTLLVKAKIHPLTNTILTCWFKLVLRAIDILIFRTVDQAGLGL